MDSCRTCLRPAIADRGHFLFDPSVRPATDILISNTSLKIFENDGLPHRICDDCFAKLISFQDFCQLSIESDITYRKNNHIKVEFGEDCTPTTTSSTARGFVHIDISEWPAPPVITASSSPALAEKRPNIKLETKWSPATEDEEGDGGGDDSAHDDDDYDVATDSNSNSDSKKSKSATIRAHSKDAPRKRKKYAPRQTAQPVDKSTKYTCDECGKYYYEKVRLAGHLRQHFGLRGFPCDRCPKQYKHYCKLLEHQQNKHAPPEPDQPTMCPHEGCGKMYRLPRLAQDHHERIHLGLRPKVRAMCVCDTCGKSFMTRSTLLQHSKSHMGIDQYPYQCEICGKRFLAKYNHNLHMLRHNNIRNFPCPMCPSRMVSQLELKNHMAKTHKDNRPARTHKKKLPYDPKVVESGR